MTETKPEGITPAESWAGDVSAPGNFFRRAALSSYGPQSGRTGIMRDAARQVRSKGHYVPPADVAARARSRSPLFVRFGEAPDGGRSSTRGGRRGDLEPGVCVFRARREGEDALVVDASESPLILAEFHVFTNAGRPAFYATGEEVGFGTGGEPCLKDPRLEPVEEGTRICVSGEWPGEGFWSWLGPMAGRMVEFGDMRPELRNAPSLAEQVDDVIEAWGFEDIADERRRKRSAGPSGSARLARAMRARREREERQRRLEEPWM